MTDWDDAVAQMQVCRRCPLAESRRHVVVYRGGSRPSVLFVGEAPGRSEDETGLPFVGRAGKILDRAIAELGLREEDWGVTNEFMCRPPGNVYDRHAASACRPWLDLKIRLLGPRLLVPLGAHPLRALLPGTGPILTVAGTLHASERGPVFPLLHPAATVRRIAYAERWNHDVAQLRELLPRFLRGEH